MRVLVLVLALLAVPALAGCIGGQDVTVQALNVTDEYVRVTLTLKDGQELLLERVITLPPGGESEAFQVHVPKDTVRLTVSADRAMSSTPIGTAVQDGFGNGVHGVEVLVEAERVGIVLVAQ
jgi:hypothetical protein